MAKKKATTEAISTGSSKKHKSSTKSSIKNNEHTSNSQAPSIATDDEGSNSDANNQEAPTPISMKKKPRSEQSQKLPPPELLDLIYNFLHDFKFDGALVALRTHNQKRLGFKHAEWIGSSKGMPYLIDVFRQWQQDPSRSDDTVLNGSGTLSDVSKDSKNSVIDITNQQETKHTPILLGKLPGKVTTDVASSSSGSESDGSSDASSSNEDTSDEETDKPQPKVNGVPSKTTTDTSKAASSDTDSSDSESDSESSNDSSSSSSDEISQRKLKPNGKVAKSAKGAVSDPPSSSSSSSGSGSSSEDSDSAAGVPLPPSSTSESSENDSSSEDSSSSPESAKDETKEAKEAPNGKTPTAGKPSKLISQSAVIEPSAPAIINHVHPDRMVQNVHTERKRKLSNSGGEATDAPAANGKRTKMENERFSRIPKNIEVEDRFKSNAYVPYDYANRAHEALIVTKGKGFTKAKNKGKRGSYRGGLIDINGMKGVKFED